MEAVSKLNTRDIPLIIEDTAKAFGPPLEKNRVAIQAIASKTFQYGPTGRHHLDVYYPPTSKDAHALLFFIYGGGFVSGDRRFPAPQDLVYTNVGAYFAEHGFTVVIPDYRLAPDFKYPAPVEDVQRALHYIQTAPEGDTGIPDTTRENVFVLGHSAGAIHTATLGFSEPSYLTGPLATRVKGLILSGGTFAFTPEISVFSDPYYGDKVKEQEPLALLRAASVDTVKALPPILLGISELEPDFIPPTNDAVAEELAKHGNKVERIVYKGHNHISVNLALYSGEGEAWGETVSEWCKGRI